MILGKIFLQLIIHELHIVQHFFLASLTGTFSEAPVINQQYIIIKPVKITGIPGPALDATCIAMKIEDQTFWLFAKEVKSVYPNTGTYIKEILPEGDIVFELKILLQFLWLEDQPFLQEIGKQG